MPRKARLWTPAHALADRFHDPQAKYDTTNNCKETLKDVLKRVVYDRIRGEIAQGLRRVSFQVGPPRTSFIIVAVLAMLLGSAVQYAVLRRGRTFLHDKVARAIIARQKDTPEVMAALKREYQLDSPVSLIRELWLPKVLVNTVPQLRGLLGSIKGDAADAAAAAGTGKTPSSASSTPARRQSPSDAATSVLIWQGVRFVVLAVVLMFAWGRFTDFMGTKTPFYVVTGDHMSRGGFATGDVLLMRWGRSAIDTLAAGDVRSAEGACCVDMCCRARGCARGRLTCNFADYCVQIFRE